MTVSISLADLNEELSNLTRQEIDIDAELASYFLDTDTDNINRSNDADSTKVGRSMSIDKSENGSSDTKKNATTSSSNTRSRNNNIPSFASYDIPGTLCKIKDFAPMFEVNDQ